MASNQAVAEMSKERALPQVADFYSGKEVLITGATGFLGKVLVEKLLWEGLGARPLCLLVRGDPKVRLHELSASAVFTRLQQRLNVEPGASFLEWMESQVRCLHCDLEADDLGMDQSSRREAFGGVKIVMHCAARVSWDERLDVAFRSNTLGTRHLFAACADATDSPASLVFLHVSSTFVHGMGPRPHAEIALPRRSMRSQIGGVDVPAFDMDAIVSEALAEATKTDAEYAAAMDRGDFRSESLQRLDVANASADELRAMELKIADRRARTRLSELGIEVARRHGWWDPYTLSKAFGEIYLGEDSRARGVPLVIVRPSGITSCAQEPMPGWIDCYLLNEPIIEATGKGQLTAFPGRQDSALDMVPADFVVNLMIVAATQPPQSDAGPAVYQVASGDTNPVHQGDLADWWYEYFREYPFLDAKGKAIQPVLPQLIGSLEEFLARMRWRASAPLAVAAAVTNMLPANTQWTRGWRKNIGKLKGAVDNAMRLASLYSVYTLERFQFLTERSRALLQRLSTEDRSKWSGKTVADINWKPYFRDLHIPGMRKYVLKEAGIEPVDSATTLALSRTQMSRL